MSILNEVFGRGSCEKIAKMLKVDEVFTLQALSNGFELGVRIGSTTRTCRVTDAELLRSRSQLGGPTGFLAGLLNDLARACTEQVKFELWQSRTSTRSAVMSMHDLGSDEPEFVPIASSSVDVNMYKTFVDGINQGIMAQFAVPADLLDNSAQGVTDEPDDESRKNRFERIAEEMLMDEES